MSDYMKSLHVRFRWEPELQKVRKELKRTYRETKAGLDQQDQENFAPTSKPGERAAGGCFPDILYSRFRLGIGTAGHDPETGKTIYKNVLSRPPAEAKAKLKAATEETKSLAVIKVERYTADAWMNSSKTMQKSK